MSHYPDVVINTELEGLQLLSRGKVRDLYLTSDPDALLFVATDRISVYDVVLQNGIPGKGSMLTELSIFWFSKLAHIVPNHLITAKVSEMPAGCLKHESILSGRAMLVRKAKVIPLEVIVRGYVTGSAWKEYQRSGTIHGISVPSGLVESSKLPEPLVTPSTKAEAGQHDENISPEQAQKIVSPSLYHQVADIALQIYKSAAAHAESCGLILADTKLEFGLVPSSSGSDEVLTLVDELLTPDSSRYWPLASYEAGRPQESFDKQYVRDWIVGAGFKKGREEEEWVVPDEVVRETAKKYRECVSMVTGKVGTV